MIDTEQETLKSSKVIAVVRLSANTSRPSNVAAKYLKRQGYRIIPINPGQTEIMGEVCYPTSSISPSR